MTYVEGGIARFGKDEKVISLVFTGHEFADGGGEILAALDKAGNKAGFFFTGDFYRDPSKKELIKKIKNEGHYLGAHSDKHLLYADWSKRDSTLVTKEEFRKDVLNNYAEMEKFGVKKEDASVYLPPYEWYNSEISRWTEELGLTLINFTSGTLSNADYTIPSMKNYRSSETIYNSIVEYEKKSEEGLNGFILLAHIGTHPERTDKFYKMLPDLLDYLKSKGYRFIRPDKIIKE